MPDTPSGKTGSAAEDIVLAFDFGERRIGVATANLRTRTASPLTTLGAGAALPWMDLDRLVADWRPGRFVVGMPGGDGSGPLAKRARAFADALTERYGLPAETVDEALTSEAARAELAEGRRSGFLRRKIGKGHIDRVAACLIAEQWLGSAQ